MAPQERVDLVADATAESGPHGRSGGAWNGPGIMTSMPDAGAGLTALGIATAHQVGLTGQTIAGVSLSASDILLKYTYAGDANLDGFISADDYTAIDFAVAMSGAYGWANGDFNYDGFLSADDYTAIDFNLVAQGPPLSSAGAPAAGETEHVTTATPVPPPYVSWRDRLTHEACWWTPDDDLLEIGHPASGVT